VVRPFASGQQLALSLNPYHLGFSMWEHIVETRGIEKAREICREEDDFGFIRNYLDQELADKLDLFVYEERKDGETKIASRDVARHPRSNPGAEVQLRRACCGGAPAWAPMAAWTCATITCTMAAASIAAGRKGDGIRRRACGGAR
jgi:hypothetical protein